MSYVFISYSRKDQHYARELAEEIRALGFDVWIDNRIDYGGNWWHTIDKAIADSAAFVILMSPDAEHSKWVRRELEIALFTHKLILPILIEGRVFKELRHIVYLDWRDRWPRLSELHAALAHMIPPKDTTGEYLPTPLPSATYPKRWARSLSPLIGFLIGCLAVSLAVYGLIVPEVNPVLTPTFTNTPTLTVTFTPSRTPTSTSSNTPTLTPTPCPFGYRRCFLTMIPTNTPTLTATFTPSRTPTSTSSNTPTLTLTPCPLGYVCPIDENPN